MTAFPAYRFCTIEQRGPVAILTLNRPDKLNALHPAAHRELDDAFDRIEAATDLRAVIVTGAGRAFCAGYDLRDNLETGVMEIGTKGFGGLTARTRFPVPLIAAVNGIAMGGGFEMALACDLIIASSAAQFALPEPRVGWVAGAGGIQRLPRAIGIKRALGIILTGRTVSAEEGERLGFVNEVTSPDALIDSALRWAGEIAECAPIATLCNRDVAYRSMDVTDFNAALDPANYPLIQQVLDSEDAIEGKRAFVEKRKPVWTGR